MMNEDQATVLIVSYESTERTSIAVLAQSMDCRPVAFTSAEQFLESTAAPHPRCLIVDDSLPGIRGVELLERLTNTDAAMPAVMLVTSSHTRTIVRAMKAGAADVLDIPWDDRELSEAVHSALERDRQDWHRRQLLLDFQKRMDSLAEQERQVLEKVVAGNANKVIANQLDVSIRTVESRRHDILVKLGARSIIELVQMVVRAELGHPYSRETNHDSTSDR